MPNLKSHAAGNISYCYMSLAITYISNISFCLPHSDEVVYRLCLKNSEIDINAISRWNSYKPKTVLKVWVLIRIARRVYSAIHCSYIPSTESCRRKKMKKSYEYKCHNNFAS